MYRKLLMTMVILFLTAVVIQQPAEAQGCSPRSDWSAYTVASGDTLSKIARRFNTTINALMVGNCLANINLIHVGQQLFVPSTSGNNADTQYSVYVSFQPFQNGMMLWRSDTGTISAFYGTNGGTVAYYPIYTYALLHDNTIPDVPPQGLHKPILGFGKVWGNFKPVRDGLRWGLRQEFGYVATYAYNTGSPVTRITMPEGGLSVVVENGNWRFEVGNPQPTPTYPPANVGATFQPFDRGFMIWLATTGNIYTFFGQESSDGSWGGSGQFSVFPLATYGNLPTNPMNQTPPAGHFHATQGFGRVWWNYPTIRSTLGWATAPEYGYLAYYQTDGNTTTLGIPDGRVLTLTGSSWTVPIIRKDETCCPTSSTPTPVPTPGNIEVASFSASTNLVTTLGSTITVNWDIRGGTAAAIKVYYNDNHVPFATGSALSVQDSFIFALSDFITSGEIQIELYHSVSGVETLLSTISIPIAIAPITITTQAAFQRYESGYMLWRGDTEEILIFSNAGLYGSYLISQYQPLPENPVTDPVPDGKVFPINGFGRVWGNNQGVRLTLGWATSAEQGYTMTIVEQPGVSTSYTLPDNSVVVISR